MERLTERNENGEAYYKRCYESPCDGTGEACDDCNFIDIKVCEALAAYEDMGITPEQMREISDEYRKVCEELAQYRKMDKILTEHYGCNTSLIEFAQSWIKAVSAEEKGEELYRFCVLTNEDYDTWKEHKKQMGEIENETVTNCNDLKGWIKIQDSSYLQQMPKEDCMIWITRTMCTGRRWTQRIEYYAGHDIVYDGTIAWMPDQEEQPEPYMGNDVEVVQLVRSVDFEDDEIEDD